MKIFKAICLSLLFMALMNIVAIASTWNFEFPITITDNSSTNRVYYPVQLGITGQTFINSGLINSNGLNTNIQIGSTSIPYMISTTNITTVIPNLPSLGKAVIGFYTGYSPNQTSFSIITGDGGFVTTNDTAALEPSNNFSISMSGYINTDSGVGKNLLSKLGSLKIFVSPTVSGNITAEVIPAVTSVNQTLANNTIAIDGAGNTRGGQRLYSFPIGFINQISFSVGKSGAPTGTANITVRRVSDDAILGTIGTQNVAALAGAAFVDYNANPVYNDTVQDIRILFEYSGGDAGNFVIFNRQTTDVSTGNLTTYAGAYTDAAGQDATFKIQYTQDAIASVAGISSGDKVVTVRSNGVNLWMTVNGSTSTNVTTVSATNSSNNWIWGSSNTTPYFNYIKETVGGTEKLWYQPNTMIQGTTLPDLDSTKNGAITWGTNNQVIIHAGTMISNQSTTVTSNVTPGFTMPSVPLPNTWFSSAPDLSNLPFYDMVNQTSIQTGQPVQAIYAIWAWGIAAGVFLLIASFTRSALFACIGFVSVLFISSGQKVMPMWIPFSTLLVQAGILFLARQIG